MEKASPDVQEVVGELLRLRALPGEQRVLPAGRLGQAAAELLAGVEPLSDTEVLRLYGAYLAMYRDALSGPPAGMPLARLAEIAANPHVDRRWRSGAVMELSRFGAEAVALAPMLLGLLDEFPQGAYTARDRDLLCATAVTLCSLGEATASFLPRLLVVFEHPVVQAEDRQACPFGSVSIRAHILEALAPLALQDARVTALCEQCLFDADVSLQLAATQVLTRSRGAVEHSQAKLQQALHAVQAIQEQERREKTSSMADTVRNTICRLLLEALSRLDPAR